MAHRGISEYDAKQSFFASLQKPYQGYRIDSQSMIDSFDQPGRWVVKPDQLFGKRGEHGLMGLGLDAAGIRQWLHEHYQKTVTVGSIIGVLDTFLVEPFVPHDDERYCAVQTTREGDMITISDAGGIGIEDRQESISQFLLPPARYDHPSLKKIMTDAFAGVPEWVCDFVAHCAIHCMQSDRSYCEINPFVRDSEGNIVCLDMVVKIDDCALFRQKGGHTYHDAAAFGTQVFPLHHTIASLDAKTGASLKCTILNPQGKYRCLLGGGGASVVVMDILATAGYADQIANYGEVSGNADRDNVFLYADALLDTMKESTTQNLVLLVVGGIANFSRIDIFAQGLCDALGKHQERIKTQGMRLILRRGGINHGKGLAMIVNRCIAYDVQYSLFSIDEDISMIEDAL